MGVIDVDDVVVLEDDIVDVCEDVDEEEDDGVDFVIVDDGGVNAFVGNVLLYVLGLDVENVDLDEENLLLLLDDVIDDDVRGTRLALEKFDLLL